MCIYLCSVNVFDLMHMLNAIALDLPSLEASELHTSSSGSIFSSPTVDRAVQQAHHPVENMFNGLKLRSTLQLDDCYSSVFSFTHFNAIQSLSFESAYYGRKNLVIAAPTGSGKSVIFELAMLNELNLRGAQHLKMVYLAPTKALCSEKRDDWKKRFGRLFSGMLNF